MKIHYIKSATIAIETNGVKILTDPWLTDGEYYGAWYHYPKLEFRQDFFDTVDYIYVSHIHPDHFSKATFKKLRNDIPVIIHEYEDKFLKLNLERLDFKVIELKHNTRTHLKNGVHINILAADNCNPELCAKFFGCGIVEAKYGSTQLDTLSIIDDGNFCIVNTNDCPYDLAIDSLEIVKEQYKKIDFLLVGYGGAGPFPQCFAMTPEDKMKAVDNKKMQFLNQGVKFIQKLNPAYVLPFAGTYVLGGKLAKLQDFRGVPEIEEAAEFYTKHINSDSKVILLNSYDYFDLQTGQPSKSYQVTNSEEKKDYITKTLATNKLDYEEGEFPQIEELIPLLDKAYLRFEEKRKFIGFTSQTRILISLGNEKYCCVTADGNGYSIIEGDKKPDNNFMSYTVDPRLLHKILQGPRFAHWNNAEVGSHIEFERKPNVFERGLNFSMNFFHS